MVETNQYYVGTMTMERLFTRTGSCKHTKLATIATAERTFAFTLYLPLPLLGRIFDARRNSLASGLPALYFRCLRALSGRPFCSSLHDHPDLISLARL